MDRSDREGGQMDVPGRRRYIAGDTIRLELFVEHATNLSRLFVAFSHERDPLTEIYFEATAFLEESREGDKRRSRAELSAPIPPETVSGVYNLTRVNVFSASGRLARLRDSELGDVRGTGFEVVEEPQEAPTVAGLFFID
jgi:hypothetical protein